MDDIVNNTNCVTTECGHKFHSSCLMRSVAHTGFGCPCCRNVMAETPDDEDDEDDDDYEEDLDDDDAADIEEQDMLRGFRFFCDNLDGRDHSEEDMQDEDEYEEEIQEEVVAEVAEVAAEVDSPVPSADYIAQKLTERGITMATLVKTILSDAHPEYSNKSSYNRSSDSVFGQFRIIITNYAPEPTVAVAPSQVV